MRHRGALRFGKVTPTARLVRGVTAALLACLVAACTPGGPPAHPKFVVAQLREPSSLDPLLIDGSVAENLGALVFSYLVEVDGAGRLVPDVATAVPSIANGGISRDGRRLVYHLRPGVRWQDGVPLTARDVVFTYRAVMNPRNNVPTRLGFDQIAAIDAPDPLTVRVTLKRAFAPFVTYFLEPENFPILPAHLLERRASLNDARYNQLPIGSGPYRVVRWVRGDRLTLVANPDYRRGKPAIETIEVRFIADEQTIVTGLRTGEIDAAFDLSPASAGVVRSELPGATVATYPIYGFGALIFNTHAGAVADPRVRRAIVAAIDRDAMVRKVSRGSLRAAAAPRGLFTWTYAPSVREQRYDPAAAAALLDAADVTLDERGLRWHAGRPLVLDLAYDNSSALARGTAVVIQEQAAGVGITIRLRPATPVVFHALDALGPLAGGRFALALDTVLTGYDPETSWFFRCDQAPPAGSNYARWCDPAADAAQNDALATFDQARRRRDYRTVQERVAADVPVAFLWQTAGLAVTPRTLRGFTPSPETPYYGVGSWRAAAR